VIAANEHCPVAGLAVGERAWTLQGHAEFIPAVADHLLAGRIELIGAERVAHARTTLTQPLDRTTVGQWIAHFFARNLDG
jgi:GMP synthase-like glutamine amidotransferase